MGCHLCPPTWYLQGCAGGGHTGSTLDSAKSDWSHREKGSWLLLQALTPSGEQRKENTLEIRKNPCPGP